MKQVLKELVDNDYWPSWKIALVFGIPITLVSAAAYVHLSKPQSNDTEIRNEPDGGPSDTEVENLASKELVEQKELTAEDLHKKAVARCTEWKNDGNGLFKQGKYLKAIEKYEAAIENCPLENKTALSTYHQNIAAAQEKLKNWKAVIEQSTHAISFNNRYVKAFLRRSKAHEKAGNRMECLEDITTVCLLESFQNQSNMMFADQTLKKIGNTRAKETFKLRKQRLASKLFIKQYFSGFTDDILAEPLTDEEKQLSVESGYVRAKMAWERGDLEYVIDECTQEINCRDAPPEAIDVTKDDEKNCLRFQKSLLLRATFYLLCCKNEEACKDLTRLVDMKTCHSKVRVNALIKRGSLMMQQQRSEDALRDYNSANDLDENSLDTYHHRGQYYIVMNKASEALHDFNKCIELKPDYAVAHAQRCYTKYRQAFALGDILAAELCKTEFQEIIKKFPTCSETYGLYAQAECDRRNFESADQLFRSAIETEPDNPSLYVHRGTLWLQWKQDVPGAIEIISKALQIDEECDFAYEMLATIEVQRSNFVQALLHFDKAIIYSRTETEMAHLHSLRAASEAQLNIAAKYGVRAPPMNSIG